MPSPELLLSLALAALFLWDSLLLLRPDEGMLMRSAFGRWRAGFGLRGFKLAGKEPWLANPLLPHEPVFRLRWSLADGPRAPAAGAAGPLAPPPVGLLGVVVWVAWLLLFVALPATVLLRAGVQAALAAVALLYLDIALALVLAWRSRPAWGLAPRAFALLAFECLVCPPYAANLVRRLSAARAVDEDLVTAAGRLLPPAALAGVNRECLARIDDELEAAAEGSPAAAALLQARGRFSTTTEGSGERD